MSNKPSLSSIVPDRIALVVQAVRLVLGGYFLQTGHKTRLFEATIDARQTCSVVMPMVLHLREYWVVDIGVPKNGVVARWVVDIGVPKNGVVAREL